MDPWIALLDILTLLVTALVLGALAERFGQSAIIGYLLSGVLLGPQVLHVFKSREEVAAAAELGVALLLFGIGLEFSWQRLVAQGSRTLAGGMLQVVATTVIATLLSLLFGISWKAALVIGAAVALSSTACVLSLLRDRVELDSVHGRTVLAVLLVQDMAVIPLALLVDVLGGGGGEMSIWSRLLETTLLGVALVLALYLLLRFAVPWLMGNRGVMRNRELAVLLAVVVGIGAAWSAHAAGISPALGSFVAGMVLATSPQATQIRADIGSLRTLLLTLFFSSVGMLANPAWMLSNLPLLLIVVTLVMTGKSLLVGALYWSLGHSPRNALAAGLCLAQIGEFSIVLVTMARGSILSEDAFMTVAGTAILTLLFSPYLVAAGSRTARAVLRDDRSAEAKAQENVEEGAPRGIVIIGFGPAGEAVAEKLVENLFSVTVIDLSRHTATRAERFKIPTIVGDASHANVLEHAHVDRAKAVVVALPDPVTVQRIVGLLRQLAPQALIVARVRYHRHLKEIERCGAHCVADEERAVGRDLGDLLLDRLGSDSLV